jgi:hypothetical protein
MRLPKTLPPPPAPAPASAAAAERAFVLAPALAARFAAACAVFGDAPADALADLIGEFCDQIEEGRGDAGGGVAEPAP